MANSTFSLGISALTAAFAIIALSFGPVAATEKIISPNEAYDLSVKNQLTVIDIRSPNEWPESGVPQGAQAITMHNPQGKKAFLEAIHDALAERGLPSMSVSEVKGSGRQKGFTESYRGARTRWSLYPSDAAGGPPTRATQVHRVDHD